MRQDDRCGALKGPAEIRQSNELTLSSQDFTLTQMRLKYRIIQHLQGIFAGVPLGGAVDPSLIRQHTLHIPLSSVDMDNHYDRVRKAARDMSSIVVSYSDESYEWVDFHIIDRVAKKRKGEYSGDLEVTVSSDFVRCLVSQRGWQTFYEVDRMVALTSVYSMRMYELMARQDRLSHTLNFPFSVLKSMFGLSGKYSRLDDFVRRVIRPAQEELDSCSPYTFTFRVDTPPGGEPVFRFTSVCQPAHISPGVVRRGLRRQVGLCMVMSDISRRILTSKDGYGFSPRELSNNLDLFLEYQKRGGRRLEAVLVELLDHAVTKENPKGWLISALRGRLDDMSRQTSQSVGRDLP